MYSIVTKHVQILSKGERMVFNQPLNVVNALILGQMSRGGTKRRKLAPILCGNPVNNKLTFCCFNTYKAISCHINVLVEVNSISSLSSSHLYDQSSWNSQTNPDSQNHTFISLLNIVYLI